MNATHARVQVRPRQPRPTSQAKVAKKVGPTFGQSLWTHHCDVPVSIFCDATVRIEHYGKRESCALCRKERLEMGGFTNQWTGRGWLMFIGGPVVGLVVLAALMHW